LGLEFWLGIAQWSKRKMFRENDQHLQYDFLDPFEQMGEKMRRRLEESWAGTFYREIFCRIDETPFAVLYSDQPSRPNAAINVLVGAEILKAGFGWSDEELFDHIQFNLQVRYALGQRKMSVMPYELRTLYNFRQRVSRHMQERGENLIDRVFVQVTEEQLDRLGLKTGQQRMDSVLVASNIRQMSRLQLLVEVVHRVWRMLTETDQARYADCFKPYLQGTAGQYCYQVKADQVSGRLIEIGQLLYDLVQELKVGYEEQPPYQILQRVFDEHFTLEAGGGADNYQIHVKAGEELSAESLQSPDDWEASYRVKRGQGHQGYVGNLTETCDPENELQLITQVQVGPNSTDDEQFVVEGLSELKARTELETLWTDGGYTGPHAEETFRQEQVEHIPTNIRGQRTAPDRVGLEKFSWKVDADGRPVTVTCPAGQPAPVTTAGKAHRFVAYFEQPGCSTCPFAPGCPARPVKRRAARSLNVSQRQVQVALLRQKAARTRGKGNNRRAAIESTVRSVTHPFGGQSGKLPVRGQIRVTQVLICSALMVNVRRIWRHEQQMAQKKSQEADSLLSLCCQRLRPWLHMLKFNHFSGFTPASLGM
jgi:hypothetical protein